MKKSMFKYLISLGLFLFMTFLMPELNPFGVSKAYALNLEKEKSDDSRLNVKSVTLAKGKTFTLRAYNLGTNAKISYRSADTEIASVGEDGTITAKMLGFTTITATVRDGANTTTFTCDVTVGPPAFSVKMTRSRIILGIEKSDTLSVIMKPINTAENARFTSRNSTIASVSLGGRVTGKKFGFTYLFAEIDALNADGRFKFAYCSVIVVNAEDVQPLEDYFKNHPEFSLIPEETFASALSEFFNPPANAETSATPTPSPTPSAKESLVDSLDKFLSNKFDLPALRKELADRIPAS